MGNKEIFHFGTNPEAYVCNYLMDKKSAFIYIRENMPVHVPKSKKFLNNTFGGRFRSFPVSKMVTHHVEELNDGINSKKLLANNCAGKKIFPLGNSTDISIEYFKLLVIRYIARFAPQSSWIRKKKIVVPE